MELLNHLNAWHWLGLAALLFITEMLVSTSFFLVLLGSAALILSIVSACFPSMNGITQLLLFAFESIGVVIIWRFYLKLKPHTKNKLMLNQRARRYVGKILVLEEAIINGQGKVKIEDSIWTVSGEDLPKGAKVEIIGCEGMILKIKPHDVI
ncbi:MAG: nodulation efficiency family protein [Francisellaceae bacterium]|nr:nodulation efficiency family protein [Francisellaceae bacterium]